MKLPAGFFVLSIWISSSVFAQKDYEIRLNRPLKAGDQCRFSIVGKNYQEMQADADGQVLMHTRDDFSVEYAGVRKVLEVEPAGRPTKVSDNIEKLLLIRSGRRTELAKPGAVIVASIQGKKKIFQVDGQAVDAESAKALELVVDISQGGPTDDDIFGTKSRKRPGETWDMNGVLAVRDLARRSNVDARNLSGKVAFESVTQDENGEILNIKCQVAGDAKPVELPALVTSFHGPFKATLFAKYPVDVSLSCPEGLLDMSFLFEGSGQTRTGAPIHVTGEMLRSVTYKLLVLK
ncbi:MAG TPA: hypothetical protein VNX27_11130 [Chthoniobacterales bacterium]|jgi:hypothetical protein|nr:hypothetical protein [Chthoniobacterales bacterium]